MIKSLLGMDNLVSLSSPRFRLVLCLGFILAPMAGTFAQGVSRLGSERRAHAPMTGDQVHPSAVLSGDRGIVVWEDNLIDAHRVRASDRGTGIAACLVDADLNPVSLPFRVHQYIMGDQRQPRVALLPDGGALFTFMGNEIWRGRRPGQPSAFVRFMSSNGRMFGRDISLTPRTTRGRNVVTFERPTWRNNRLYNRRWRLPEQIFYGRSLTSDPIPLVLQNGQPAVIYSQVRRVETNTFQVVTEISTRLLRSSIYFRTNDVLQKVTYTHQSGHDIYLQPFDPRLRRPAGEEILINQFLPNNQRHPAAAVLADGRIMVVWVSQDFISSLPTETSQVVIRGRFLGADGLPVGDDFIVSEEDQICARPTVSASSDGGFAVAWNQRAEVRNSSWDIYARVFDGAGRPMVEPFRANEETYGDQYAPALGGVGGSHVLSWVSLNQDGSRGGVYARQIAADGPLGSEFGVNTSTANQQIQPCVVSSGDNDATILWSGYMGVDGFEIMAQEFRTVPPLPAPEPPVVTSLGETLLQAAWEAEPVVGLQHYALYMDGGSQPVLTSATEYLAENLSPGSTHAFRLAYVLSDGRTSLRSAASSGTTDGEGAGEGSGVGDEGGAGEPEGPGQDGSGATALTVGIQMSGEEIALTWNTTPGTAYQVQISSDLDTWVHFREPILAEGTTASMEISPKEKTLMFRVVEGVQP